MAGFLAKRHARTLKFLASWLVFVIGIDPDELFLGRLGVVFDGMQVDIERTRIWCTLWNVIVDIVPAICIMVEHMSLGFRAHWRDMHGLVL